MTPRIREERRAGRLAGMLAATAVVVAVALWTVRGARPADVYAQGAAERLAQADGAPVGVRETIADRLDFRHIGVEQGLPSDAVTAVAQDAIGFIWIATSEGLVRYDGAEMRPFRHRASDSTTVPGPVATALAALPARNGRRGALWVGTTSGLARYDPATESFTRVRGLPAPDVTAIAVDSSGGAWVALRGGGVAHVTREARLARVVRAGAGALPSDEVYAIHVDAQNVVWAGTAAGLVRIDPRAGRVRTFVPEGEPLAPIAGLAARAAGGLYLATQGTGLWRFDPATGAFTEVPLGREARVVSAVHEDGSGTVWAGTLGGGLWRAIPGAPPLRYGHRPDDAASLVSNEVSALLEDRQGVLWVATYEGLSRFDLARGTPTRFRADADDPRSLSSNRVLSVLPTDSALYVGTAHALDISTDDETFRHVTFRVEGGLDAHPVTALTEAPDGTVWVGTEGAGVYRLRGREARLVPLRSRLGPGIHLAVHDLLADDGVLWVATVTDGLLRYDAARETATAAPVASREVTALARTPDGALWAGTPEGVCRRPADGGPFACRSLPDVTALAAQGDALWVGTRTGLVRLDPRRPAAAVARYTAATSDLPSDIVLGIAPGEMGILWIATGEGLVRFHPPTGVFAQRFGRFGAAAVFNRALVWRDSLLYAGGTAGLLRANPANLRASNPHPPAVVLTGVEVGGQAVVPDDEAPLAVAAPVAERMDLDPGEDYVTFRFAGLHFSDPSAIAYRFRLLGDDDAWRPAGSRREATYTNLAPGRYTFEVVARTSDGVEGPPLRLDVVVHPPWYRTVWAYLALTALVALALVQIGRWQQARALRAERDLARRRETELRAETSEARRREAEAEATALKAENDRAAAEVERAREVQEANTRLEAANERLETSLHELRATQAQLVQAEKLASLGQLTAGIAHEIKNPLNFINNFAELLTELARDIETDLRARPERPVAEALDDVEDLLADLTGNALKIREHGQRADRIVRSMLAHSRGGSGERALMDVNRYVDEYANLAFHGARANIPDFNVTLVRDFAEDAGEAEVVPAEFGRVLINLLSNAFHAVHTRRQDDGPDFAPTVTLRTRRDGDTVVLSVEDNGIGIPDDARAHIFEPFFTTKAAGEGTGLGLSLVHDIVTQLHGGTVDVQSVVGEGTTFTIRVPERAAPATAGQHAAARTARR